MEFDLSPTKKRVLVQARAQALNAELVKLPEIIETLNRYQAVAHLASFDPELGTELETELKKMRKNLNGLGVGASMLRKLEGKHVENYVRYLDTFMHTYEGVVTDLDADLEMELAILKGMIRHAHKIERSFGTPVIDTMLKLLSESGYSELNQSQLQKLGALIHQQQLNSVGMS